MSEYFNKTILTPIVEYAHHWYLSRQSLNIVSQPDQQKLDRIQQLTSIFDTSSEHISYILTKTKQIPVNLNYVLDSSKSMFMNIPFLIC
jgi:type II secretory pathway component GspD/PulD (secretin)